MNRFSFRYDVPCKFLKSCPFLRQAEFDKATIFGTQIGFQHYLVSLDIRSVNEFVYRFRLH